MLDRVRQRPHGQRRDLSVGHPFRHPVELLGRYGVAAAPGVAGLPGMIAAGGVEPFATTPAEFAALIRSDYDKYGRIVKSTGIKLD